MNYQINNYNINVFANSVSPHEGFDQNHLKIKANNVYRQKYLKFLEPNEMNTYKKMCINDSAVLVESFELFVTGKYMLVEEE